MAIEFTQELDIVKIDPNQSKKETTANEGLEDLGLSLADEYIKDIGAETSPFTVPYNPQAAVPITTALRAIKYTLNGTLTGAFDLIHPAKRHLFIAENATSGGFVVTIKVSGQTGTNIAAGITKLLYCNGTDVFEVSVGAGSVTAIDDLSDVDTSTAAPSLRNRLIWNGTNWVPEAPQFKLASYLEIKPNASQQTLKYTFVEEVDLPVNLVGSQAHADVAPAIQADYDVLKNGASIGTITFAAASQTATFVLSGGASFVAGDRIAITAPSPQDASLSGVAITILGDRS